MILVWLILLFATCTSPVRAQIPLYYQLLEAYHPNGYVAHTTGFSNPEVLGTSTTLTPTTTISPSISSDDKPVTIAVLGDSMIDTLGPGIPALKQALKEYFPKKTFNVLNYGVGSRDVEYGLYRLTNNYEYLGNHVENLISKHPDIVVIESFAYNNYGNSQKGIDRHWLAMGAITTTLQQRLPQVKIVIATTIAPNSIVYGNGIKDLHLSAMDKIERSNTTKLYLQNAINFASSQGFPLADAYHPSMTGNDGRREYISSVDNLHPSASGATLFTNLVAETIAKHKLLD